MPTAGLEPAIPRIKRLKIYALDCLRDWLTYISEILGSQSRVYEDLSLLVCQSVSIRIYIIRNSEVPYNLYLELEGITRITIIDPDLRVTLIINLLLIHNTDSLSLIR